MLDIKYKKLQEGKIDELQKNICQLQKEIEKCYTDIKNSCDHKGENGDFTIDYDSCYEMRSDEMHCTQCYKCGTRKELTINK